MSEGTLTAALGADKVAAASVETITRPMPPTPAAQDAGQTPAPAATVAPAAPIAELDEPVKLSLFDALATAHIESHLGDSRDAKPKFRFGITRELLGNYMNYRGPATAEELAGMTEELARKILMERIWTPIAGDKLPEPVAAAIFDVAVRKGVEEAGKLVQKAVATTTNVALKVDGRIGRETVSAISHLIKEGQAIALAEQVIAHRNTFAFRLGDGKLFGRDINFARAAVLVGKAALRARTGIAL